MVDVILTFALGACFGAGFWAGKTYGSATAAYEAVRAKVRSWL